MALRTLPSEKRLRAFKHDREKREELDDYVDARRVVPYRDGERPCDSCGGPVYSWERCRCEDRGGEGRV